MAATCRILPLSLFGSALALSLVLTAGARAQDAHTTLLLHCDGTMAGAQGETPATEFGISYEAGIVGNGAFFAVPNQLRYNAPGNINAKEGTLEFWMKPRWNGNDGQTYIILAWGEGGGMLFAKDGANNLRSIFNRYSVGGQSEIGVAMNVGGWTADRWHHVAYTWSDTAKSIAMYVDGSLVRQSGFSINLPDITSSAFQIGAEGTGSYLNSVVDELRISDVARTAEEIAASYMAGLTITGITLSPETMEMYPTWRRTPRLDADTPNGPMTGLPPAAASWTVSNPAVAEVIEGTIYALRPGTATVTATLNGQSDSVTLTVKKPVKPPSVDAMDPFLTTPAANALFEMPVLVIRYLPTLDGKNVDGAVADWSGTLDGLKTWVDTISIESKFMLEEGSRFRGYKDATARPSLGYRVLRTITVYEPMPPDFTPSHATGTAGIYFPDYWTIARRFDVERWVNEMGVKEVWLYGYHHGNIAPVESNMSSPTTGDVSNSYRFNDDLPVCNQTWVLYNYNYTRSSNEAVHNHGHQLESILSHANAKQANNVDLFWKSFSGRNAANQEIMGRCGNTHIPPNTLAHYDYWNLNLVDSDIEDWTPANTGVKKPTNANTWGNMPYAWPYGKAPSDLMQHHWYIYWMQAMPGLGNTIPCGASVMSNWWAYTAEWDTAIKGTTSSCGLWTSGSNVPPDITDNPASTLVGDGRPLSLTVSANGAGLTYRWRHNGREMTDGGTVSGSGTATLTVSSASKADAGRYDVVVSNGCAFAVSRSAWVNVVTPAEAVTALQAAAGLRTATESDVTALDVSAPAGMGLPDAVTLLRAAAGL
jgi:hypothetical protein